MNDALRVGAGTKGEALRLMWWLVVPVLALLVVLSLRQYDQRMEDAERGLLRRAQGRAQELEALARPAVDHVHDLRRLLETHWHDPPHPHGNLQQAMKALPAARSGPAKPSLVNDGWSLDRAEFSVREQFGQIWWAPTSGEPPVDLWLDRAALFMRTARVAHERSLGFQGSYFVAAETHVSWGYPWIGTPSMLAAMGVPSLQALEPLRVASIERGRALIKARPEDITYWGRPYVGQLDGDLVQSHGAVLLVDREYKGEVSVDFRIDSLQKLATQWQDQPSSRVWVIDKSGYIVADSMSPLERPTGPGHANLPIEAKLSDRLPSALAHSLAEVLPASPNGRSATAGDWILLAATRTESPWVYVHAVPLSALRSEVAPSLTPNVIMGLALLVVFVAGQLLFARWFVTPALGVLQYLQQLSTDPSTREPELGRRWRGWIRAITDTMRRQDAAQQQLAMQRETLRQNEKLSAMGTLLAGVAHELNNPLAIVMGRASLLEERIQASDSAAHPEALAVSEDARRIREAADRCGRIVRTFLNMARQKPAERSRIPLNDVVRSALDMWAHNLRSHDIHVETELTENLPTVRADIDQLAQVVLNLIANAQQAMEDAPEPRVLRLSTGCGPLAAQNWMLPSEAYVWMRIVDSGLGVPEENRERLFEPFFTTKPLGTGTGLGLSVSRSIAREHGGELQLEHSLSGACFLLALPVVVEPGALLQEPRQAQMGKEAAAGDQRILVVDDEPEILEIIRSTLERAGYEVAAAESGAVALAMLDEATFDAIVSDMRMPDLDGRGLWHAVRQRDPNLAKRMLFVTGDTLSAAARSTLSETGCTGLDKPFERSELVAAVQALLRSP